MLSSSLMTSNCLICACTIELGSYCFINFTNWLLKKHTWTVIHEGGRGKSNRHLRNSRIYVQIVKITKKFIMYQLMFSSLCSPSQRNLLYAHRHFKIEINKLCPSGFLLLQTKSSIITKCHFLLLLADFECTYHSSWLEGIAGEFCWVRHCIGGTSVLSLFYFGPWHLLLTYCCTMISLVP